MKKLIFIISICILATSQLYSQQISFDFAMGFKSGIGYTNALESDVKPQLRLGIAYEHKFTSNWSLISGVQIGWLNSEITLPNTVFTSKKVDSRESAFELKVTTDDFKETQNQSYYRIPLLAQYTSEITQKTSVFGALGVSYYGFINQRSRVRGSSIQVSGYYPDTNVEIDNAPNHGFGRLNNIDRAVETTYKNFLALSLEAGFKWDIKTDVFLGVFFDYGLTNLQKSENSNLVSYNGLKLNYDQLKSVSNIKSIGEPSFYSVGLKFRLGLFNLYKK